MTKNQIRITLYLVGAVLIEEAHQFFRAFAKVKIYPFPFDDTKISVQWYVYDLSNCISAVLIALALHAAFTTRNMKSISLCYFGYRVIELLFYGLWDKQIDYTELLLLFDFLLYIILSQWKKQ